MKYRPWKGPEDNNSSTIFLLPITNMQLGDFYSNGFVNTFLGDDMLPEETKDKLIVVMQPENTAKMEALMSTKIRTNKLFLFEYDVIEDGLVCAVFDVPIVWEAVLSLFKQGKYSMFPEEYKRIYFPRINPITKSESHNHKILYKEEAAFSWLENKYDIKIPRNQEAWSKPRCHQEIFRYQENSILCWKN